MNHHEPHRYDILKALNQPGRCMMTQDVTHRLDRQTAELHTTSFYCIGVIAVCGLLLTFGCSSDPSNDGGIGGTGISFALSATSSDAAAGGDLPATDQGGTVYDVMAGEVFVRDIELDLPDGTRCSDLEDTLVEAVCDVTGDIDNTPSNDKIRIVGPFAVDLITRTSTPSMSNVRIPAGTYKRIDIRIDDGKPGEAGVESGDPLDDRSIVAEAGFTYKGDPTLLKLSLKINEDVRFEDPDGIVVAEEGEKLLANLDVAAWFTGVDIAACIDDADLDISGGEVIIDDDNSGTGSCSGIENTIKENIKRSGQLDRE